MAKMRLAIISFMLIMLGASSLLPAPVNAAKTLYIGGSMALTGAYAENVAAVLAAFEDYAKYVNETKKQAPWLTEKFPADITLEVLWRDDELKPAKALTIYEELKAKGMLVFRVSGSPQAFALKERLSQDGMGTTSMASPSFLLKPPQTIFTHYPLYTDALAAVVDWFKEQWKETRKPRVAYLTADNSMGKSIETPEMEAYLRNVGCEFVGSQYVPLVPSVPPTTQMMWLKQNRVDLALGVMINPGLQPTLKEAVRLGMGPHLEYKITFGCPSTAQVADVVMGLGEMANGYLSPASLPPWDEIDTPGVKFSNELQKKYHPQKRVTDITYEMGLIEAMTQVEALRLALKEVPFEKLKPVDVLNHGFYKIKNFNTGDLSSTPLTYAPGKVEGIDKVRVYHVQKGKAVRLGLWPCRHLY